MSFLVFSGAVGCTRSDTSKWVKHWVWSDDHYDCQLFAFGKRPPCAAVIFRVGSGYGTQVVTGVDWVEVGGIRVVDDGKLTIHWMNGKVHQQTVLESGPLFDALRAPKQPDAPARQRPEDALLDAFFAEHAK